MDLENAAVEEAVEVETDQEVAEPDESSEEGSNYQEVANPESEEVQSHEENAKFQAMRHEIEDAQRKAEEAERKLAEYEAAQKAREEAYAELADDEESIESIIADAYGVSEEEVRARIEQKAHINELEAKVAQYEAQAEEAQRAAMEAENKAELERQLADLQKIDPSIKSVADFEKAFEGLSFAPLDYLDKGLTLEQTYWALKAEKDANHRPPPPEVGGIKSDAPEADFISKEDAMAMTPAERTKNWKLIRKSQEKWT